METIVCKFRTALAGFHREDVLNYITQTSQNQTREVEALQEEVERERQARMELEDRLDSLRSEQGSAAAEESRVRASLEEATLTLGRVRGELAQAEQELAQVRMELVRRQEQVDQLEPTARKYEELKDRVATVELDAHRTAQATVDEARAEADSLRKDARQWLESVIGHYDGLRRELVGMSDHARAMQEMLEQVQGADVQLAALKERGGVE